jgi:predicted dinucleotide-binding enzyme
MKIAIIGAGNVGGSLGQALSARGHEVRFGVRDPGKITALVQQCGGRATASDPAAAVAFGEVVIVTLPWQATLDAVAALPGLEGKVLIDTTNPIAWADGPVFDPAVPDSAAQRIAALTGARVVKLFSTHGAELNLAPRIGDVQLDTYLCGDDAEARRMAVRLAEDIGFRVVDAGPLRNAASLEHLAILWVHLAMKAGHGRQIGFKLLGSQLA